MTSHRTTENQPSMNDQLDQRSLRDFSLGGMWFLAYDRVMAALLTLASTLKTKLILSLLGCSYGSDLRVDGRLVIRAPRKGAIQFGDHVHVTSRFTANLVGLTNPSVLQCLGHGRISIGNYTGLSGVVISARTRVQIGNNVKLGGNVRIFDHDYHSLDFHQRRSYSEDRSNTQTAPVVIGDDVLVGANAIILKGVHLGSRCVVGAGAVVTLREVPDGSVVAGNPARVIRTTCLE